MFCCKVTIETFAVWGFLGWLAAFCTPVLLGIEYFNERNRILELPWTSTRLKTCIALTFFGALISLLYYSAEFGGFLAAREVPEAFMSQTDRPELAGKRLFLLGQSDSSYALLTSKQPEDYRTIVLVRKDKVPALVLGPSVPVLQPIKALSRR